MNLRHPNVKPTLLIALLALLAVAVNFDRLLLGIGATLPGSPEQGAMSLWHLWWVQYGMPRVDLLAINSYSGGPFLSNHLRYLPVLQSWIYRILRWLVSPIAAFNLLIIAGQVATHIVTFYFLKSKRIPEPIAAVAATAIVLSAWYTGILNEADIILAGMAALPLALMAWDAWLRSPSVGRTLLLVGLLYAGVLSGVQNIAWIVGLWLPYAIWTGRRSLDERHKKTLPLMLLSFFVLIFIYPMPAIIRTLSGTEPAYASLTLPKLPELVSFVGILRTTSPILWLFGAGALLVKQKESGGDILFWLGVAIYTLLVGVRILPEPLQVASAIIGVEYMPLYDAEVFFGMMLFALAMAGSSVWQDVDLSLSSRWMWGGVAAAMVLVLVASPGLRGSLISYRVAAASFYTEIAAEPEDYLILNFPLGLANDSDGRLLGSHPELSVYAAWHQKRTVGGVAPYYDPSVFESYARIDFVSSEDIVMIVNEWRIGYVIVHPDYLSDGELATVNGAILGSGAVCPPIEREGLIIYRAMWHPLGCEEAGE